MADIEKEEAPYDFGTWYPLRHGTPRELEVVRETEPIRALAPDRTRLVVDGTPRPSVRRATRFLRREHGLGTLARRLPAELACERWHVLPGTGGGYVLLAAENARAFRHGLAFLPGGRRRWRMVRRVLAGGAALGWSALPGAAGLAVITHRGAADEARGIASLRGPTAAIASGVEGVHRKISLRLIAHEDLPDRVAKIASGPGAREQIEKEAHALASIERPGPCAGLAPRLLDRGVHHGTAYLVQECLRGARSGDAITAEHVTFLVTLQRATGATRTLEGIASFREDRERFRALRETQDAAWSAPLARLEAAIEDHWRERPVPCALAHGDFTPWNLLVDDGRLRAFDWEYSRPEVPALHDLAHFVGQTGVLVRHHDGARILAEFESLRAGDARALFDDARLSGEDACGLFALYLFHAAVYDAHLHTIERPSFAQVEWLRRARLQLADLLVTRLASSPSPSGGIAA